MNERKWIRQTHRWLSITFTLLVIINIALNFVSGLEQIALWVGMLTLLPLALLMLTGLYLFALPYLARRRASQATD
jgi:hypothetical protein